MMTTALATNNSGSNEQKTTKKNTPWNHWKLPRDQGKATASFGKQPPWPKNQRGRLKPTEEYRICWDSLEYDENNNPTKSHWETPRTITKISGGWSETTTDLPLITTKTDANHQDLPSWVAGQIWISGRIYAFRLDLRHQWQQQQQPPATTTRQPPTTAKPIKNN